MGDERDTLIAYGVPRFMRFVSPDSWRFMDYYSTVREEAPPRGQRVAAQALGNPRGLKPAARSWPTVI